MEFNLEDGEHVVKSLTRKVMSALGKLRISPKKSENARVDRNVKAFTDNVKVEDVESFAEVYDSLPYSLEREEESCEIKLNKLFSKVKKPVEVKNIFQHDKVCCKKNSKHSRVCSNTTSKNTRKWLDQTVNTSHELSASPEPLNLSTSYSMCLLNRSRAKLLETGLGLNESLRNAYLNCSPDSQNSLISSYTRPLTKDSFNESSFASSVSYNHPEVFRVGSDTDSTASLYSSNFSSCSADSDLGSVKIRYDTSSEDTSFISDRDNSESHSLTSFEERSYTSEMNETESPFSTRLPSFRDEFSSGDLNESEVSYSTSSLTEEFKHDIDYLAKSTFRTSTPDSKTIVIGGNSIAEAGKSSNADISESSKNFSRKSFMSVSDSLELRSRKHFVHGLSPLCNRPSTERGRTSSSRAHVRRGLLFVSPCKNIVVVPKPEGEKSADNLVGAIDLSPPARPSSNFTPGLVNFPNARFSRDSVLPKIMFQDETEEAVYYLITKYLDNSQCKW